MTSLRHRLLEEGEPVATMFTREGYMKYVVSLAMAERLVTSGYVTPQQIVLSQSVPMLNVPQIEAGIPPRNRHERRAAQRRNR